MVHTWPGDDTWDRGVGGAYGSHSTGYVRLAAWTANPGWVGGGTEWQTHLYFDETENHLYSGHFSSSYGSAFTGPRRPAVCTGNGWLSWSKMYGWAFRNLDIDDCEVSAAFQVLLRGSEHTSGSVRFFAVGARISGTLADSGDETLERLTLTDGYWFVRGSGNGLDGALAGYKYYLLRVKGGVITRLAANNASENGIYGPYSDVSTGRHTRLRMTVNNNGGDVDIVCYATLAGVYTERTIITYTDTDSAKIITAGRVGFAQTGEYYNASMNWLSAHACLWFQCRNFSGTTLYLRDEWERLKLYDALLVVGDESIATGYSLAQGWSGDLYGLTSDLFGRHFSKILDYDSGLGDSILVQKNSIDVSGTSPPGEYAYFWHQRPAGSTDQHRSLDVRWPTPVGTGSRSATLILRESGSGPTADDWRFGYGLRLTRDDSSGDATAQLVRKSNTVPAEFVLGTTPTVAPVIAVNTWYELEIEALSVNSGPNSIANSVKIKCYLGGVQLVFNDPGIDGITVLSDGTVYDESDDRRTDGLGEGFCADFSVGATAATDRLLFNDFQIGGSAGSSTPPEAQLSITIDAEDVGKSGTLVVPADWPVVKSAERRVVRHGFEADYEYTAREAPFERRRWKLVARAIQESDRTALLTFWNAHGVDVPFTWVTDEGESVTVHFVDDAMQTALLAPDVWSFEFELEELHS